MDSCISVDNLNVDYISLERRGIISFERKVRVSALKEISFDIKRGEIVALLGANGAGKSTLLSAIGGRIKPSQGTITTTGKVFTLKGANPGLVPSMSARQNVRLLARAYGIEKDGLDEFVKSIEDFCDLGDAFDRKYSPINKKGRAGV